MPAAGARRQLGFVSHLLLSHSVAELSKSRSFQNGVAVGQESEATISRGPERELNGIGEIINVETCGSIPAAAALFTSMGSRREKGSQNA